MGFIGFMTMLAFAPVHLLGLLLTPEAYVIRLTRFVGRMMNGQTKL